MSPSVTLATFQVFNCHMRLEATITAQMENISPSQKGMSPGQSWSRGPLEQQIAPMESVLLGLQAEKKGFHGVKGSHDLC